MILAENTVVANRFRLSGLLGRGGMGSVWRAVHLGLDIPCAVKFIEGELAALPEAQARFEREAKAAAQLRSPHVVQILDHGVCEGTPYIAMELLEGEDFGKRLARVGRLPARDLSTIVSQVCRALTKAHSVGIVHRDLKPDNIFLVKDDDREIVKVLDFGIAKSQSSELSGSNTKTGALLGTPYYMSPEQAQGTKQVDFRTDLWALAVICFQALTGRLPFESEALGDLLVRIIVSPIPVPSQYGPVPPGFDAWWQKAASREPRARFESAKSFSDSLSLVCGVTSPGASPEVRAAVPVFRAPAVTTGGIGSPMARTLEPQLPKRSAGVILAVVVGLIVMLGIVVGGYARWRTRGVAANPVQATALPSAAPPPPSSPSIDPVVMAPGLPAAPIAVAPSPSPSPAAAAPTSPGLGSPAAHPVAKPPAGAIASPPKGVATGATVAPVARTPAAPEAPKPGKPAYDVGF